MEKLKNKIFWVILLLLSAFLVSIIGIFNFQDYNHEKVEIKNKFERIVQEKNKDFSRGEPKQEGNNGDALAMPIFMDVSAYGVKYSSNYEIKEIINYAQNDVTDDEIKQIAEQILKKKIKSKTKIGNLYFEEYSYSFEEPNTLIIIENSTTKTKLDNLIKTSMILFVLIEILIIIVSKRITSWIIKPVIESFNKQKQFVADASHELKTPIAVIMANAEALEREPHEEKWLTNIKSEAEQMNELVTDLLDLAKLEEGKEKISFSEENVSKLTEMAVLTLESLIYESKIKLEYNIEENIKMKCNGGQIKQLVTILLDNAIKHSSENGEIKVELKKQKSDVILIVSNIGEEIPKEMQEKIFERFYRVDESRNRSDNRYGLGLAIAKNIVVNHNGKISLESENKITKFKVIFHVI